MKPWFSSQAHRDVDAATAFYVKKGWRVAEKFLIEIDAAADAIRSNPLACPIVSGTLRRYVMRRYPFGMYYRVTHGEIIVVAVTHAKRDPLVWRSRE